MKVKIKCKQKKKKKKTVEKCAIYIITCVCLQNQKEKKSTHFSPRVIAAAAAQCFSFSQFSTLEISTPKNASTRVEKN